MSVEISYMGTKRRLANVVGGIVRSLPKGPMLDAFSGMCAVAENVGQARQIWTNDVQIFPAILAKALFCSKSEPYSSQRVKRILEPAVQRNLKALERRFKNHLNRERRYLGTEAYEDVIAGNTRVPYVGSDPKMEAERRRLARKPNTFPYRLATITYAGSFFGVRQCMEIDSLRYAMDKALEVGEIGREQRYWLIIALGQVASRVNNSTGQFAQYIKPHENNIMRIIEKRRRSVWGEFFGALDNISPLGSQAWRSKNRSFYSETLCLLSRMKNSGMRPAVVYADPPYSSAQYSRYYHVLDVLAEYRYPPISGAGRYPDMRFQTPFGHTRAVFDSMSKLVERASNLKAYLVLSYPANGLFCQQGGNILKLLRRFYKHATVVYSNRQQHSTFGGPKTSPKVSVVENIFLAYS